MTINPTNPTNTAGPASQVLRLPGVMARTGLSRSTLYALLARGDFVQPIRLSTRTVGFLSHEVDAWIEQRATRRVA